MTNNSLYNEYKQILQKAADINNAAAVLGWDQEVYMPPKGAHFRGRQLATLAAQAHELLTGERLGHLLDQLKFANDLNPTEQANVLRSFEDYSKNRKLTAEFVEKLSMQTSACFNAWIDARRANDFSKFAPSLEKMVALKRKQAEMYQYESHPYDALLDEYEPGIRVATLDKVFSGIKTELPVILSKIKAATQVDDSFFYRHYPKQQQWDFSMTVLKAMGYDLEAGRQDLSEHPFTTSFAPTDVRVTTRVSEDNYASLLWSTIHEGGHALYEQGLPEDEYGMPCGAAASLGIHESQSRLWENCIGRGGDFWNHFFPILKEQFPTQLSDVTATDFFKATNKVEPSFIRTEADEITYHFHVLIRYEIEKALIEGQIEIKDLPAKWNDLYTHYLGITPPDDITGVLQDVHWSHGSFGYFPTYTLGSFYAAQFYAHAKKAIPTLESDIAKGHTAELLSWLRRNIHVHGRRYTSEELCELVTGEQLNTGYFLNYVKAKYASVYNIDL
jgi:carboxypeptidase Taq